jgi:indole-3-glycerol phosphate synthase
MTVSSVFGTILKGALIADIEYEQAKASGASTLLEPNNFQAALAAVDQVFTPSAPATPAMGSDPAPASSPAA